MVEGDGRLFCAGVGLHEGDVGFCCLGVALRVVEEFGSLETGVLDALGVGVAALVEVAEGGDRPVEVEELAGVDGNADERFVDPLAARVVFEEAVELGHRQLELLEILLVNEACIVEAECPVLLASELVGESHILDRCLLILAGGDECFGLL